MRISVSGGGGGEFRVHNDKREDLVLKSSLTPAEAVEKVAEWLAVVPAPVDVEVAVDDGHATFKAKARKP